MRVTDQGHRYLVENYDGIIEDYQVIEFMKRQGKGYPFNVGEHSGTNCQELLRVLIDRVEFLNKQSIEMDRVPDAHDEAILQKLREVLWLFEDRAAIRHGFKPEDVDFRPVEGLESEEHCRKCGHILCHGH